VAPVNTCTAGPCDAYDQAPQKAVCEATSNACEVRASAAQTYEYVLVVTVPPGSTFSGLTYAIRSTEFPKTILTNGLRLPSPAPMRGRYLASQQLQALVGRFLYESTSNVVVPSRTVAYRKFPGPSGDEDASALGLPLDLVFASGVTTPAVVDAGFNGPGGTPAWSYEALLTTTTAQAAKPAAYELVTTPEPPFDDAYPPVVRPIGVLPGADATLDPEPVYGNVGPNTLSFYSTKANFRRENGRLDGFHAWFSDGKTGRRLSNVVALSGELSETRLAMFGRTPDAELEGLRLVIQPPEVFDFDPETGVKVPRPPTLPTYEDAIVGVIADPTYYPNFPNQVSLTGSLRGRDGPTEGVVFFESRAKGIETKPCPPEEPDCADSQAAIALRLRTWVRTSGGAFSIRLPRGTYDVHATPAEGGLAKLKRELALTSPAPPDIVELAFAPLKRLRGRCLLTDGRFLGDAEVEARPAMKLLESKVLPAEWPRPARTRTNANGDFILALDPGLYDIVVRPAEGTRLPWLVHPNTTVGDAEDVTTIDDLKVPAPFRQAYVVRDANGFGVVSATVRAFANIVGSKMYVETGRALTDASGRFELYLAPAPR
jgi:hypothetical protein